VRQSASRTHGLSIEVARAELRLELGTAVPAASEPTGEGSGATALELKVAGWIAVDVGVGVTVTVVAAVGAFEHATKRTPTKILARIPPRYLDRRPAALIPHGRAADHRAPGHGAFHTRGLASTAWLESSHCPMSLPT
jgi:hypothetical protein